MPDLEVAELYRQYNRFGISVTSCSHATRYAILDRYQPVETSHYLVFDPSKPLPSDWLARAKLHLQYLTSHPVSPAVETSRRYCFGLMDADAPMLDLKGRFGAWLQAPRKKKQAYFV
jgi:hypothetical protein